MVLGHTYTGDALQQLRNNLRELTRDGISENENNNQRSRQHIYDISALEDWTQHHAAKHSLFACHFVRTWAGILRTGTGIMTEQGRAWTVTSNLPILLRRYYVPNMMREEEENRLRHSTIGKGFGSFRRR